MQTLWRCVFDVAHVEVKTPAIEEKTPVARRFLVIPIVQIDRAGGGLYLLFIESGWTPELQQQLLLPRQALHSAKLSIEGEREWNSALPADLEEFCSCGLLAAPQLRAGG